MEYRRTTVNLLVPALFRWLARTHYKDVVTGRMFLSFAGCSSIEVLLQEPGKSLFRIDVKAGETLVCMVGIPEDDFTRFYPYKDLLPGNNTRYLDLPQLDNTIKQESDSHLEQFHSNLNLCLSQIIVNGGDQ